MQGELVDRMTDKEAYNFLNFGKIPKGMYGV